jgi:hypothetical protein
MVRSWMLDGSTQNQSSLPISLQSISRFISKGWRGFHQIQVLENVQGHGPALIPTNLIDHGNEGFKGGPLKRILQPTQLHAFDQTGGIKVSRAASNHRSLALLNLSDYLVLWHSAPRWAQTQHLKQRNGKGININLLVFLLVKSTGPINLP